MSASDVLPTLVADDSSESPRKVHSNDLDAHRSPDRQLAAETGGTLRRRAER